jgi:hypothetical protein
MHRKKNDRSNSKKYREDSHNPFYQVNNHRSKRYNTENKKIDGNCLEVKLPSHRPALPGNVMSFYIVPLDPAYLPTAGRQGGACSARFGQVPIEIVELISSMK